MWVARNRTGELRCFEMPPRRFHSGSTLSSEKTGFNDAVYIDDGSEDTYSFWAVQKYYESNRIEGKEYGFRLMKTICTDTWGEYEPEWCKDLKWEDEPIEVDLSQCFDPNKLLDIIRECGYQLSVMQENILYNKFKKVCNISKENTKK